MEIRSFYREFDQNIAVLQGWVGARAQDSWAPEQIPALAWIILDGETPVATAFIRRVEGGFGQLDGLCTNPSLPGATRHEAIDLIVAHAIKEAYVHGITSLYALSVDEGTLMRSEKHGFVRAPHVLIVHNPKGAA